MRTAPGGHREPSTVVLSASGELDLAAVPELRAQLAAAHLAGATVVLDVRDVTFMDSSGLAVLLAADRRLRSTGGRLRLAHVADDVLRVLRICGLADRFVRPAAPPVHRCRGMRAAHRPAR